jgi:hypothetical protein
VGGRRGAPQESCAAHHRYQQTRHRRHRASGAIPPSRQRWALPASPSRGEGRARRSVHTGSARSGWPASLTPTLSRKRERGKHGRGKHGRGNSRLSSDLPVNNRQRTGAYFLDCNHEVQTCPAGRSPRAVARRPGRPSFCICQPRASRRPFRRKTIREIYYIQTGLCPQGFFARDVTLEPSSAGAAIARNGIRRPLAHRHDRVWPLGPYLRTTACT